MIEATRAFNQYFDRLTVLSKDRNLNSRMRFGIEELLELRDNRYDVGV
jgi:hypothetical protein